MKIKCMYYDKKYSNKPQGYEIIDIQKNLTQTTIDIVDLAKGLSDGATFKPALLNGTKSSDFISQQLYALDFDNNTTIQEELNRCKQLNIMPCFGYISFSHKEEHHKFRLVFCTNAVITDVNERNKLQLTLIKIFSNSDIKTKDATRLFYGGRALINNDYERRINADEIIYKYCNEEDIEAIKNSKIKAVKRSDTFNKPKAKNKTNYNLYVETIKALNVDVMKALMSEGVLDYTDKEDILSSSISVEQNPPVMCKSEQEVYNYINSIDLCKFTGIPDNKMICCILPEHNDKTPSAHIFRTDDGTQIYKCFGCNKSFTIISLVERLAWCKRSEAIKFIKQVYNIKLIQSDLVKEQKQLLLDNANYLDSKEFQIALPELAKLIRTRKHHIQKMLLYFTQYVNDDMQVDGKPIFFSGYPSLMEVCGISRGNRTAISQTLALFTLLNMLIKLEINQIPEKELTKAKAIAAKYGHKKLTNFYSFDEYGVNLLLGSEKMAKVLKRNNMTLKGLSREYVLRTFGQEVADKVYPQYKYENALGTTKQSNEATMQLFIEVLKLINEQGYAFESDIKGTGDKEIQWKKSIQDILNSYGLRRIRLNRELKEQYGIVCKGYPFIICRG